jgi:hypothetical protein
MTTLAIMKARIVRQCMNRDDLTTEIADAITSAIEEFQSMRFHFNEKRDITFPTVAAQSDYTVSDNAFIPNLYGIDSVTSIYSGNVFDLDPIDQLDAEQLIASSGAQSNFPLYYSYYQSLLRLYPIPDAAYTVRIAGHVKIAAPASDGEAANPWMIYGERLIRSTALAELHGGVMEDAQGMAGYWEQKKGEALGKLQAERSRRQGVMTIEPSF